MREGRRKGGTEGRRGVGTEKGGGGGRGREGGRGGAGGGMDKRSDGREMAFRLAALRPERKPEGPGRDRRGRQHLGLEVDDVGGDGVGGDDLLGGPGWARGRGAGCVVTRGPGLRGALMRA